MIKQNVGEESLTCEECFKHLDMLVDKSLKSNFLINLLNLY